MAAAPLAIGGVPLVGLQEVSEADALETFRQLCTSFRINEDVGKWLVQTVGLRTLEDYSAFITSEAEIETKVTSKIANLAQSGLQAARLRQAWLAIRKADVPSQETKKRGEEALDLEDLLPLRDLKQLDVWFYQRYKLQLEVQVAPSDALVSSLSKQLDRRMLQVQSVFKVKTLRHSLLTTRKRRKIGSIELVDPEEAVDEPISENVSNYLELLQVLMYGLAKAGVKQLDKQPAEPEGPNTRSSAYVHVPLDVVLRYHRRAVRCVKLAPPNTALTWLQQRDERERQLWVERYRFSNLPLGQVIEQTMLELDHAWEIVETEDFSAAAIARERPEKPNKPNAPSKIGKFAAKLKDGTRLCPDWNNGGCSEKCLKKFLHACSYIVKEMGECAACGTTEPAITKLSRVREGARSLMMRRW